MALKTYQGSCHCGVVHYEAELDLEKGGGRCNCGICRKTRQWASLIKPAAFRVTAGEEMLADYSVAGGVFHHRFCKTCGVRVFNTGNIPELGGDFVTVHLSTLDGLSEEDFAAIPISFADGKNNNWWNAPAVTSYL